MGVFRRFRDTKTSASRRTAVAGAVQDARVLDQEASQDVSPLSHFEASQGPDLANAVTAELPVVFVSGEESSRIAAKPLGRGERTSSIVSSYESRREVLAFETPDELLDFEVRDEVALDATGVNAIAHDRGAQHPDAEDIDNSDVFVCRHTAGVPEAARAEEKAREAAATVTLFVYGWHQVQPGPLSWVFPSLRAALDAVRTMRNAVEWCICSGESWEDIESARANGAVLIEQLG